MSQRTMPNAIKIKHPDKIFVNGEWIDASTANQIDVISPNSEQIVARVAEAKAADMDLAVSAARKAFDDENWSGLPVAERARYLAAMAEYLESRSEELNAAWTAQVGGMVTMAPMMTAGALAEFGFMAAFAESFEFETSTTTPVTPHAIVRHEPVGVVAAIAPWNGPFHIMAKKITPALLVGCTVVMKPSPETPLEAYIIAEAAEAVGLPPGVLNLVCGHRDASDHLVSNPGIDKVGFTGSSLAGKRIASVCGSRIARCTLELGGKSAAILLDDLDPKAAAKILGRSVSLFSGQVCALLSRAIVPRSIHDQLAELIAAEMATIKIGYSDDPSTEMGPVAMARQLHRIEDYIQQGKESGADLICGGKRPEQFNRGYFMEPTLFANVDNNSVIAQEEIFGPVLSLIPYDDEDHAIQIANDSNFGLSGGVLTNDPDAAYRVAKRMRTGGIGQNGLRLDYNIPFGGFKQSGIGREGGVEGLLSYCETKCIMLDAAPSTI